MSGQVHLLTAQNPFEERLAGYLRDHPDFFERHRDLLQTLRLPGEDGRALSLVERQLQTLRTQVRGQRKRLADLIRLAEEHDRLQQRLLNLACHLLASPPSEDRTGLMRRQMQQDFALHQVVIRRRTGAEPAELQPLFELTRARCGSLTEPQREGLFGEAASEIRSCAVIPLRDAEPATLLALGSTDEHRFHPGMGTDYLARLGEIVTSALQIEGKKT